MSDKLKGFIYDGTFPLDFLERVESVRADSYMGKAGCQIIVGDFSETHRVSVGDCVARSGDGKILVIETSKEQDAK